MSVVIPYLSEKDAKTIRQVITTSNIFTYQKILIFGNVFGKMRLELTAQK